ncbi:MAG: SRPBCC family protein [Verrucomicrobiota bacterium]
MLKKSMLTNLLIGLAVVVVLFLIVVAARPNDFRVSRSGTIGAPPDAVFPHVNELRHWEAWNPWGKLDPNMKVTYEGPPAGVGASYSWVGNHNVGEGRMTVSESRANEVVRFKLEFFKPFKGLNDAEFTFKPDGSQTLVTWTMTGQNNFIAKAMGLFIDCDKMVGGQFEKGLAQLKTVVESGTVAAAGPQTASRQ